MRATFRIEDERLTVNAPEANLTANRPLGSGDLEAFEGWAATYQSLREKTGAEGPLIDLGRALYRWLDGNERWLEALLPAGNPPLIFEFQALATTGAAAKAFLQAPWELLAESDGGFLAGDAVRLYCALRRSGRAGQRGDEGATASERRSRCCCWKTKRAAGSIPSPSNSCAPTCYSRAAISTEHCASAARSSCRSMSGWAGATSLSAG